MFLFFKFFVVVLDQCLGHDPQGRVITNSFPGTGSQAVCIEPIYIFFLAALRHLIGASVSCIMNFVDVCQLKWTLDYNIFYKASCIP